MAIYIHQLTDWPRFTWQAEKLIKPLAEARSWHGRVQGGMAAVGLLERSHTTVDALSLDLVQSFNIEGEQLDRIQVRSSIAQRLGVPRPASVATGRSVEGAVAMLLDATQNTAAPLTVDRLYECW